MITVLLALICQIQPAWYFLLHPFEKCKQGDRSVFLLQKAGGRLRSAAQECQQTHMTCSCSAVLVRGFCLQSLLTRLPRCWSTRHHICTLARKAEKQSSPPPTLFAQFHLVLRSYWLEFSHMATPSCKGSWECSVQCSSKINPTFYY